MPKLLLSLLLFTVTITAQTPTTKQYPIDNNHSNVGFSVPIMGGLSKVEGKFTDFTINLVHNESDVTKSSVDVMIKVASINTGIAARDNHLKTADFFDAEKYPEATFKSTSITRKGKQLIALGTLTMHGFSKEISLPFTVVGVNKDAATKKMNVGYSAHLTINRRDFGINWTHKTVPNFVGDNIDINIELITKAVDTN
jgi:polyisoprenoid-binding protein YceI